jgi:hypothetical protein
MFRRRRTLVQQAARFHGRMIKTKRQNHRKSLIALAGALALVLVVAACGGSSSSAPSGGVAAGGGDPQFKWDLKFVGCLRSQGIEIEDPRPTTGFPAVNRDAAFTAASKTCEEKIGDPPAAENGGPTGSAKEQKTILREVKCMREHGIDMADPGPQEAMIVPEGASPQAIEDCLAVRGR